jgi:hypothetical protein
LTHSFSSAKARAFYAFLAPLFVTLVLSTSVHATDQNDCKTLLEATQKRLFDQSVAELIENPHHMNKTRNLRDYHLVLDARSLVNEIAALPEGSVVMDIGPGEAIAMRELAKTFSHLQFVVVDLVKPKSSELERDLKALPNLSYIYDELFEKLVADRRSEIAKYKGHVAYLMDVMAMQSYGYDFSATTRAGLEMLKPDGIWRFNVAAMNVGAWPRQFTSFRPGNMTKKKNTRSEETLTKWLQQSKGFDLLSMSFAGFNDFSFAVALKRNSDPIELPPLILPTDPDEFHHYHAPPRRVYVAPTVELENRKFFNRP